MNEKNLDQAVIDLGDELFPIEENLKKACLLLQEITDDYFRKYNSDKGDDRLFILYSFERYGIYADMIDDYVLAAKKHIDKLNEIQSRIYEQEKLATV